MERDINTKFYTYHQNSTGDDDFCFVHYLDGSIEKIKLLKMKFFKNGDSRGKSLLDKIEEINKGLSPLLSEKIINEILPKIAFLILELNKKK